MRQYLDLLEHVLENGNKKGDRTGTGTISTFGYQMRFDLNEGFPLLTTKKLHLKSIIHSAHGFEDTNIAYLKKIKFEFGMNGLMKMEIWGQYTATNGAHGRPDGKHNDQIRNSDRLKSNPDSRRHIVGAWNVSNVEEMALPPCHCLFQFYVANNKLSCQLTSVQQIASLVPATLPLMHY